MAMIRHISPLIIQRVGDGDGVALLAEAGVKMTVSIFARRSFWMFA